MIVDYVIVGAGSAGSILAERLSRSGRYSVAVLEAGGTDRNFWVDVPLGFGRLFYNPKVNWAYDTEADPGLNGRSDYWPRGKILGGSSSINALVYIRGDRTDFDDWANEGNPGWSWSDVAPYFDEIEDRGPIEGGGSQHYGLNVHDVSDRYHPLGQRVIETANALQLPFNPDFNGETQEGIGHYRMTSGTDNRRMSSARAFLRPALGRKNLRIEKHAHATRIEFDGKRAHAVHYRQKGELKKIEAGREVIIASGAIGSPQLLQQSGIGSADLCQSLGIDVVADNPNVGEHLQDHLGWAGYYRSRVPTINNQLSTSLGRVREGLRYLLFGTGPLALSINQAGGFFKTDPSQSRPNMQLYFQAMTSLDVKQVPGVRPTLTPDSYPAFSLGFSSCRPKSRGSIKIKSSDPFDAPEIQPNSFSHPDDMPEMLAALKFMRRLAETAPLSEVVESEIKPGDQCVTDDDLENDIRARSGTTFHPCGTCRMAPTASNGAVDPRLRVHGIEGLRVIDASIFPSIPSGNINAPSIMVGAKGAAMILEDAI